MRPSQYLLVPIKRSSHKHKLPQIYKCTVLHSEGTSELIIQMVVSQCNFAAVEAFDSLR